MQRTMGFLIGLSASAMLAVACGAKESGANPADRLTGIVVREEIPEGSSLVRDAVRDASTVTGEEKAARAQFGWGNGADVLDVAQRDTLSRDLAGVPHPPFPMTDEEYRRYSEHNEAVLAAGPVIDEIVAKYSDVLTEVAVDTSSLHLRLVLTYKYGEDPTLAAAALRVPEIKVPFATRARCKLAPYAISLARARQRSRAWYRDHLAFEVVEEWGPAFTILRRGDNPANYFSCFDVLLYRFGRFWNFLRKNSKFFFGRISA